MKKFIRFSFLAALGLLYACAHHGTIPATSGFIAGNEPISTQTIIRHGNFTEYTLPAGQNPGEFTRGPYSTLWYPCCSGGNFYAPARVGEFIESTGATHVFTVGDDPAGSQPIAVQGAIISVGGGVIYVGEDSSQEDENWAIRVTPQGAFTYKDLGSADAGISNFTLGADGNLWYAFCPFSDCISGGAIAAISPNGFVPSLVLPRSSDPRLDNGWCPNWVQAGPLNDLYTTAQYCVSPDVNPDSRVYVNTTAGTIVHKFPLPNGSHPTRLVTGSDHNLWILQPDVNKIARMTPTGVVKEFAMRTAGAGLLAIAPGADGALWFTENKANKIGRITTTGIINEWVIPTANSKPVGIAPCTTACPPHGGVWFTEGATNRIGKFVSPL